MAKLVDIHTHNPRSGVLSPTMAGIHPWDAERNLPMPDFSACDIVGETGLDYAKEVSREAQQELFLRHLTAAEKLEKPVVLHVVKSFEDVMIALKKHRLQGVVFHGFIGSREQAQRAISEGYYLSFGDRSLRSPRTREVIATMPIEKLFCETDDNTEFSIEKIYQEVAALRAISHEELASEIEKNYRRLFDKR
jgi:TatD DNase family protein